MGGINSTHITHAHTQAHCAIVLVAEMTPIRLFLWYFCTQRTMLTATGTKLTIRLGRILHQQLKWYITDLISYTFSSLFSYFPFLNCICICMLSITDISILLDPLRNCKMSGKEWKGHNSLYSRHVPYCCTNLAL